MKSTCQAGVTTSILRSGLALAALIGLSSCGGDTPEAVGQALADASGQIDWVAEDERACVGGAILDSVGFEALAQKGVNSETLTVTPTLVDDLLTDSTPELDAAVEDCIDADRLFRASLAADLDIDTIDCDTDFGSEAIAESNRSEVLGDGTPLTISDTPEHRELLRPCLDDEDFASTFGLDDPTELSQAIDDALPVSLREASVSERCLADRLVSKFGVETLEGVGLTVATPALDLAAFSDAEAESISDSAVECSEATEAWRRSLFTTDEPFADCAVQRNGAAYNEQTVAMAFDTPGAQRARSTLVEDGLEACANEHAAAIFDNLSALDRLDADFLARSWTADWERDSSYKFVPSENFTRCAMRGTYAELGRDAIDQMFIAWGGRDTDEAWASLDPFFAEFQRSLRACGGDWYYMTSEIHQAGASPETLECIRDRMGSEEDIETMADALLAYVTLWDDYRWESVLTELDSNFDRCRSDSELRIYNEWNDYMLGSLDLTGVNTGIDTA